MITMQSTHPRLPLPSPSLPPPDAAPEQRQNGTQRAGALPPQFEHLLARLEEAYEFHTMQLEQLGAEQAGCAQAFDRESLVASSRRALTRIAAALKDMADGRYGICRSCGRSIPLERLEARPEARHCVRCQAASTA